MRAYLEVVNLRLLDLHHLLEIAVLFFEFPNHIFELFMIVGEQPVFIRLHSNRIGRLRMVSKRCVLFDFFEFERLAPIEGHLVAALPVLITFGQILIVLLQLVCHGIS